MLTARSRAAVCLALLALAACARGNPAPTLALTADTGQAWSLQEQTSQGKAVALTFGYTHCTDTCPLTLHKLQAALQSIGPKAAGIEVAFATVDPARDTPSVLHAYLAPYGPDFTGLTGTQAQIDAATHAYHVWAQRIPGNHGAAAYDESHTSAIFFVDKNGNLGAVHDDTDSVDVLAKALAAIAPGLVSAEAPAADPNALRATIQARYDAQCRAIVRGDYAAMLQTVGAGYVLQTVDGERLSRDHAFRFFVFPLYKPKTCTVTIRKIERTGPAVFVDRTSTYEASTAAGMPGTGPLVKRGERISEDARDTWAVGGDGTLTLNRTVLTTS